MATYREEYDQEMRELKREIIESRGLVIKTNNLTNALSADLKSMAKRQQSSERRLVWTSATAYVVFVIVVFVALKLAWDARLDAELAKTEQTRTSVERLSRELREAQKREEERGRAETKAAAFYELVRLNKRAEILEQYDAIRKEPLSKAEATCFADAVDRARNDLSSVAYYQGKEHARFGRWHEAQQSFEESIKHKESAAHTPSARYHLADALRRLGRQRDAVPMLQQLSEASPDKEILDDALFLLAQCLIDIQAWNDAKTALRSFIRRFPESPFANDAKIQLADISLKH
ncbi:MAG: tetratricopeptide repeat protein [Polyangiaceae bacterium]|jgi:TolA-binding protein|nr:tetratricopeptide repeat protein [Polyangiaceae bacterium]